MHTQYVSNWYEFNGQALTQTFPLIPANAYLVLHAQTSLVKVELGGQQ